MLPTYGRPAAPRADLALLNDRVDAQATPKSKVCGLGSSYTFSGPLIDELMLTGEGIASHYRRSGKAFHLQHGVPAVVFERLTPLSDADMAAR